MKARTAFFIFLTLLPARLLAWGPEGHQVIADVARARLTPTAREHMKELLGNDDLAAISVWADDVRHDRPETFGWHFVDIPMNASGFSEQRDCFRPDEKYPYSLQDHHNCVVDRITMFKQVLADRSAPKEQRVEALKFLVHFVGDLHQPMHAIGEARGGNDIHIVQFGSAQCGKYPCNLHYTWDIGLIEHTGLTEEQYVRKIKQMIASQKLTANWVGTPEQWANESFQLAKKVWLNDGGLVDEQYYERDIPIVNGRLEMAGMRLAVMLNQALGK
jgi:S1/P1 Nuclease